MGKVIGLYPATALWDHPGLKMILQLNRPTSYIKWQEKDIQTLEMKSIKRTLEGSDMTSNKRKRIQWSEKKKQRKCSITGFHSFCSISASRVSSQQFWHPCSWGYKWEVQHGYHISVNHWEKIFPAAQNEKMMTWREWAAQIHGRTDQLL